MFRPLEIFIGLRYLRAKQQNRFVSFITVASLLGVALGVAALIVILSVMNGFENELRGRLLSMTAHAKVEGGRDGLHNWRDVQAAALRRGDVVGAAPYIEMQAMLANGASLNGALVRGIDPAQAAPVDRIGDYMIAGSLNDLTPGSDTIVLGRLLAIRLGVGPGDRVTVLIPQTGDTLTDIRPRLRRFTVGGLFEVGLQEHDGVLALINIEDAAALAELGRAVSGVRLEYDDVFAAPIANRELANELPPLADGAVYRLSDWTIENASYFRAIRIEKTMMSIILLLIVAVAVFNIVATLMMVVTDKRPEIAILRTQGISPSAIVRVFMIQGMVIGWLGTLVGIVLGVLLALNVGTIVPGLEKMFGFQIMPGDVYYITQLPSDLQRSDVQWIALSALLLSTLATIYPARRAAQVMPAEALRYD